MTMQIVTQLLCALSLYGGIVQMILAWFGISVPVLAPLALCVLAAGLCSALRPRPWRWLAFLLLAPAGFFFTGVWAALALAPMLCFAAYTGLAEPAPVRHDVFLQRFRACGFAYALLLLPTGGSGALARCEPALALLFFFSGVLLLRLSRYDAHALGDRRFRILNAGALGLVCAAGAVLSNPTVLKTLGSGIKRVYQTCLAPILTAVFSVFAWMLGWIAWLFSWLLPGVEETEMPTLDGMMVFGEALEAQAGAQTGGMAPLLRAVLLLLGAAALLTIAFILLRVLWKYARPQEIRQTGAETREALRGVEAGAARGGRGPRFGPRRTVRQAYVRSLRLLASQGLGFSVGETSADVLEKTRQRFGETAAQQLRRLYLPARYCETRPVGKAEARAAKEAYQQLKKELEAHG